MNGWTGIAYLAAGTALLAAMTAGCSRREVKAVQEESKRAAEAAEKGMESGEFREAMFGGGCFWGVEETFLNTPGVVQTAVGFSGGHVENPSYRRVCRGDTGHAEVVHVVYDPEKVRYEDLLEVFWNCHDPTQVNRQGPDVGSQYRSAIFFYTEEQAAAARASREALQERLGKPIATEITPASTFYRAEEYHQRYLQKQGRGACGPGGSCH